MRSFLMVFITLSLIFVVSCAALKQEEIDRWLTTISGAKPAEIEITGKWRDSTGTGTGTMTWGEGYLHQEQNKVRGVMGYYNIKGIVSGKKVYLVFLVRDKVHYTARLENLKDLIIGNYFRASDKEQKKGYEISFVRMPEK